MRNEVIVPTVTLFFLFMLMEWHVGVALPCVHVCIHFLLMCAFGYVGVKCETVG